MRKAKKHESLVKMAQNMRTIMTLAHQLRRATGESFSECLKKAWSTFRLSLKTTSAQKEMMCKVFDSKYNNGEIVHFAFIKKDGSFREAYAQFTEEAKETLRFSESVPTKPTNRKYWDLGAQGWRQYIKSNIFAVYND